jgi:phosphohistidine phosphatase
MRTVYLLRHGIAVAPGTPGIPDDDRPLTPEGLKRAQQAARGLARLDLDIERIVSSPLPRAWQTAEIAARALDLEEKLSADDALRAGRPADSIAAWLASRDEARLLIVGHDPAFSNLVVLLTTGRTEPSFCALRKGGIAALVADRPAGPYRIDWIARPRLLRRLGDA